jgi:hypothetical protein
VRLQLSKGKTLLAVRMQNGAKAKLFWQFASKTSKN